ncbi:hypothetical protein AMS59_22075 [Lysinibacillus sp. FJAT-14745]|uniref:hypothetical protein n=1 Tax=Lysinibacillus sp. FJAT-14745 TaxID=1704289 RepID=UPI0006AB7ACA|nr:hypothetical protein [Lysinibacillus sp. FJAT-14745]KOP69618.1 hypothetical protein AMS59_22075 [Lysinibacillus sp. FJAT-14745]
MKKLSLSLAASSIFLSMLFTPAHNETVHAKVMENKVNSSTDMVGLKKPHTNSGAKEVDTKIESANQLKTYLDKKYSELKTDIVTVNFNYTVTENDDLNRPYDFFIDFNMSLTPYDLSFEYAMRSHLRSIKHQDTAKEDVAKARKQLNDFIETMAKDVIEKLPNKKILGQDYNSWYLYPNLKMNLRIETNMSWTNYEPISTKHVWVDKPDDYSINIGANMDPAYNELERNKYRREYALLKYNDFKITDFGWRKYLDDFKTFDY